jgi:hypothetical protein
MQQQTMGEALFRGIQQMRHMYAGTVPPAVKAQRRKKNKAARKARRLNR